MPTLKLCTDIRNYTGTHLTHFKLFTLYLQSSAYTVLSHTSYMYKITKVAQYDTAFSTITFGVQEPMITGYYMA